VRAGDRTTAAIAANEIAAESAAAKPATAEPEKAAGCSIKVRGRLLCPQPRDGGGLPWHGYRTPEGESAQRLVTLIMAGCVVHERRGYSGPGYGYRDDGRYGYSDYDYHGRYEQRGDYRHWDDEHGRYWR
jgi:hypothetical protein